MKTINSNFIFCYDFSFAKVKTLGKLFSNFIYLMKKLEHFSKTFTHSHSGIPPPALLN